MSTIFDISDLMKRLDNDREFLCELFAIFKSDLPLHLHILRMAVASGDASQVATEGHTLKGMLLNLSAIQAAVAAGELEIIGRNNRIGSMTPALAAFEMEVQVLLTAMEKYSNEFTA